MSTPKILYISNGFRYYYFFFIFILRPGLRANFCAFLLLFVGLLFVCLSVCQSVGFYSPLPFPLVKHLSAFSLLPTSVADRHIYTIQRQRVSERLRNKPTPIVGLNESLVWVLGFRSDPIRDSQPTSVSSILLLYFFFFCSFHRIFTQAIRAKLTPLFIDLFVRPATSPSLSQYSSTRGLRSLTLLSNDNNNQKKSKKY